MCVCSVRACVCVCVCLCVCGCMAKQNIHTYIYTVVEIKGAPIYHSAYRISVYQLVKPGARWPARRVPGFLKSLLCRCMHVCVCVRPPGYEKLFM